VGDIDVLEGPIYWSLVEGLAQHPERDRGSSERNQTAGMTATCTLLLLLVRILLVHWQACIITNSSKLPS
jgi:hypothetical protein